MLSIPDYVCGQDRSYDQVMIKAILFDFGGVITTSPFDAFEKYENEIALPSGAIRHINSTNPDTNAWAKFERNEILQEEFITNFEHEADSLGYKLSAQRVLDCLQTEVRPNMLEAIRNYSFRYKIAILTNNLSESPIGPNEKKSSPTSHLSLVTELVDEIIESSKIGVRKPDMAFYEKACDIIKITPKECVFLDDLGINLKPARQMGMRTIKVMNEKQALEDLDRVLEAEST